MDIQGYIEELQRHLSTGEAREHTYRPAAADLFTSFNDIQAANDQARTEHGATDFVFYKKSNTKIILGYAEAKDINVNLDKTEKSEQLARYVGYDNLILTNYIDFRFFRNGKKYEQIEIAKLDGLKLTAIPENYQHLKDELANFFEQPPEVIKSGKRLAAIMGGKARRIRQNVQILIHQQADDDTKTSEISKIYGLLKETLVKDMSSEDFADMYAQTLVYGLFVARYGDKTPDNFSRQEARDLVPASNPFLREFFDHIAGPKFERRLKIIVDELCDIFVVSDVATIINKHYKLAGEEQQDSKDPIIHFYEDFLAEYDPAVRKKMGAYYTPTPVVRYMIRAVDKVLKEEFGLDKGLADTSKTEYEVETGQDMRMDRRKTLRTSQTKTTHKVQILDPATGTGTFLNEVIRHIHSAFKGQEGMWPAYAKDHLVQRLHGFELMMGAYTIAHLKLGLSLKNLGVETDKRLGVYLTNSLEEGIPSQQDLFSFGLAEAVTAESEEAAHIKSEQPIMVIIGNPPYAGVSSNETEYANSIIDKYKVEPGGRQKLQERKHWLNDDYVKFIALAEDLIEKNGEGVLAFITNNGFLDNPTFRGMRWHLTETFDKIDIIDLHGNTKKKETTPDGSRDQNVFDIQQGVAIIIASKTSTSKKAAAVRVADIYGDRKTKFNTLDTSKVNFKNVKLHDKMFYFVNKSTKGYARYKDGFSMDSVFCDYTAGVVTANDKLSVFKTKDELKRVISDILESEDPYTKYSIKDSRRTSKEGRVQELRESFEKGVARVDYRPFDKRYTLPFTKNEHWINSPRTKIMNNFLVGKNYGMVFNRRIEVSRNFADIFISNTITDARRVSLKETNYVAPLWLYDENGSRFSNMNQEIVFRVKEAAPKADEKKIFDYIYGILYWPEYRKKYNEFLKIDFPRVPYPKDQAEFDRFAKVGEKLRNLHLMADPSIDNFVTTYPITGDNEVNNSMTIKQPGWIAEENDQEIGRVCINETQYFGDVPKLAWEFYIGGYQPAQKWLKDRKSRTLSADDITHYQRIIKILTETDKIMKNI